MASSRVDPASELRARAARAIGDRYAQEVFAAFDTGPAWSGELELGLVRAAIRVAERAIEEYEEAVKPRVDPDTGAPIVTDAFARYEDRARKNARAVAKVTLPKELAQAFGLRVNLQELWQEVAAEDMMSTLREEASADPRSEPFKVRLLRAAQRNAMRHQHEMGKAQRPVSPLPQAPAVTRASVAIQIALDLEDEVLGKRPEGWEGDRRWQDGEKHVAAYNTIVLHETKRIYCEAIRDGVDDVLDGMSPRAFAEHMVVLCVCHEMAVGEEGNWHPVISAAAWAGPMHPDIRPRIEHLHAGQHGLDEYRQLATTTDIGEAAVALAARAALAVSTRYEEVLQWVFDGCRDRASFIWFGSWDYLKNRGVNDSRGG